MNGTYQNIDCMELMATLKDKEIDLAIVDPPYTNDNTSIMSIGVKKGYSYIKKDFICDMPNVKYFSELFRVSKNQIIWGGNYFTAYLKSSRGWIFWDKNNGDSLMADGELAWTSFDINLKKIKVHWTGSASLWEDTKGKIHITQKPVKLYEWLLTNYAKPNDLILDTHCGSASSLIACENLGFKYVASELDKDYYEQSLQRLKNHLSQGKLFQRVGRDEIRLEQPSMFA